MDVVRRLRRVLRPARGLARRARASRGDLGGLLRVPNVRPEDIRWVARTAQTRGETGLTEEALLLLVRRKAATTQEERALRALSAAGPAPAAGGAADLAPAVAAAGPAGPGVRLLIWREAGSGPLRAKLVDAAGVPVADEAGLVPAWQRDWDGLPRSLADQLAVCALTRVAQRRGVAAVRAGGADVTPLAGAVAAGAGVTVEPPTTFGESNQ